MAAGHHEPTQGHDTAILAEEWDGSRSHVLKTASPAGTANGPGMVAVACPTTAQCLAVGAYSDISRPGRPFAIRETWRSGQRRI